MRALLPAMMLAELEQRLQARTGDESVRMIDYFDFVSGTSAGAILACLYTLPDEIHPCRPKYSAQEVLNLYLQGGPAAFNQPSDSRREKYCATHLEQQLQKCMGPDTSLDQLIRPIQITAFNVDKEAPVFFESWASGSVKVWEAARASSAAPGYFAPAKMSHSGADQYLDGSVFAANPALCALGAVGNLRFSTLPKGCCRINYPAISDTLLLSLGTGQLPAEENPKKGSLLRILMKTMMSTSGELVDRQLQQLFNGYPEGRYFRFNPELNATEAALDAASPEQIAQMQSAVRRCLKRGAFQLEALVRALA